MSNPFLATGRVDHIIQRFRVKAHFLIVLNFYLHMMEPLVLHLILKPALPLTGSESGWESFGTRQWGQHEVPMTELFLMLLRYQQFHTPAEGIRPWSDETENHMLKEHQCAKKVTEEHSFQGFNSSRLRHICTAGAWTPSGGVSAGSEGRQSLGQLSKLPRTLQAGRDRAVFSALGQSTPVSIHHQRSQSRVRKHDKKSSWTGSMLQLPVLLPVIVS